MPLELSARGFLDGSFDAGTEQIIGLVKTIDELLLERRLGPHHFVKGIEDLDHLGLELELRTIGGIFDLFALGPKRRIDACDGSLPTPGAPNTQTFGRSRTSSLI